MRCSGMPRPTWMSGDGDVDPELHPQRPAELQLRLEPALGQDVHCVAGEHGDVVGAGHGQPMVPP